MATLNVKNFPDDLLEALRRRAAQQNRTLRGELVTVVREAVQTNDQDPMAVYDEICRIRRTWQPMHPGTSTDEMLAEDRDR